jgi:hypothetical protein
MKGTVRPGDLAVKIIEHCCRNPGIGQERSPGKDTKKKNTRRKKKEDKGSLTGHAHGVLYFLWKLANSTGGAVNLKDPPDHESVVLEMDSRAEALKEWIEIARQRVEEENLGRKPPARDRSAVRDGSEVSAESPEESPEPEGKERSPPEGKARFSFQERVPAVASIRKKAQPSSPPDNDQSRPSSDESVPERTSRKKARGVAKLPQPKLGRKGPKEPPPRKREEQRTSRKGGASRRSNLDDYHSESDSDDREHGGDGTDAETIVPPNADRRAVDPLAGTRGRGPGIGDHGTDTKMTIGTEPRGRRWREEVMAGTLRVHPPLPIDPPQGTGEGTPAGGGVDHLVETIAGATTVSTDPIKTAEEADAQTEEGEAEGGTGTVQGAGAEAPGETTIGEEDDDRTTATSGATKGEGGGGVPRPFGVPSLTPSLSFPRPNSISRRGTTPESRC